LGGTDGGGGGVVSGVAGEGDYPKLMEKFTLTPVFLFFASVIRRVELNS
jgi:hypothetical protein